LSYQSALEKLRDLGMHGMVAARDGIAVAEAAVKPYSLDKPHTLNSLTKSFVSVAVGFCVQEGLLSLDDKALSFFPGRLPCRPCENMEKITVRHLLMMATGHTKEPYFWPTEQEPLDSFLRSYVDAEPGSVFLYNTAGSHLLGYIVEKVSGVSVEEYLRPRLLEPLGITEWVWEKQPDGACKTGVGLHLSTRDIAKFGNFLLFEGSYGGKQLIGKEWIREAVSKKIMQPGDPDTEWTSGYGYQFWINRRENSYRADGAFGQFCIVIPCRRLVIAMNSGSQDMGAMLDVIFEELVPALDRDFPYETELTAPLPEGEPDFPLKTYTLHPNALGWEKISFEENRVCHLSVENSDIQYWGKYGVGEWKSEGECTGHIDAVTVSAVALAAGAGVSKSGFSLLRILHTREPYVIDLYVKRFENFVLLGYERNVNFCGVHRVFMFGTEEVCGDAID
jgi:CubicO group peptidase (beta-lactamase class C family)